MKSRQPILDGQTSGLTEMISVVDGQARIGAFRVVDGYPLFVSVAVSPEDFLAPWRRSAWLLLLASLVFLPVLGLVLGRLARSQAQVGAARRWLTLRPAPRVSVPWWSTTTRSSC